MTEKSNLNSNLIPCACGCGNLRTLLDKKDRPRKYINGHGRIGKKASAETREKLKSRPVKRGEKHWNWKGGRIYDNDGYVLVYDPEHPHRNNYGYVREHRLVMEKHFGRYLEKDEVVHHINGVKDDNRWENLEVLTKKEHMHIHGKTTGFLYLPHIRKDMSDRVCSLCESKETYVSKSGGVRWFTNPVQKNKWLCSRCDRNVRRRQDLRNKLELV